MTLRNFGNYDLAGFPSVLAWNPLAMRCAPVDEGCARCWHLRMAKRLAANPALADGARRAAVRPGMDSENGGALREVSHPVLRQAQAGGGGMSRASVQLCLLIAVPAMSLLSAAAYRSGMAAASAALDVCAAAAAVAVLLRAAGSREQGASSR